MNNVIKPSFFDSVRLKMGFKVVCDDNWYGNDCGKYCYPQESDIEGHYTCAQGSGDRVCTPGEFYKT